MRFGRSHAFGQAGDDQFADESGCHKATLSRVHGIQVIDVRIAVIANDPLIVRMIVRLRRFPNLRLLDFRKIKLAHRKEAMELFKSKRGKDILKDIAKKTKSNGFGAGNGASENEAQQQQKRKFSPKLIKFQVHHSNCQSIYSVQFHTNRPLMCSKFGMPSKMPHHCKKLNVSPAYFNLVVSCPLSFSTIRANKTRPSSFIIPINTFLLK